MQKHIQIKPNVLIVEPDDNLTQPYVFLPSFYQITRVPTIEMAQESLAKNLPELVMISATYAPPKQLVLLEQLTFQAVAFLPVVLFVVNWPMHNWLPESTWGGQIGITHSLANQAELLASLDRLDLPTIRAEAT